MTWKASRIQTASLQCILTPWFLRPRISVIYSEFAVWVASRVSVVFVFGHSMVWFWCFRRHLRGVFVFICFQLWRMRRQPHTTHFVTIVCECLRIIVIFMYWEHKRTRNAIFSVVHFVCFRFFVVLFVASAYQQQSVRSLSRQQLYPFKFLLLFFSFLLIGILLLSAILMSF